MDETFLLSNIAPQVGDGFNRHCTYNTFWPCPYPTVATNSPSSLLRYHGLPTQLSPICIHARQTCSPTSTDWAYLEDWCRKLTGAFADVYVFTVPLYLPKQDPDGKWRVVSIEILLFGSLTLT